MGNTTTSPIVDAMQSRFFDPTQPWTYLMAPNVDGYSNFMANGPVSKNPDGTLNYATAPTIDCSNLVYQTMLASGYDVSYITTATMIDIINGASSSGYSVVTNPSTYDVSGVQSGDVVVFNGLGGGHTGIITSYDPSTGMGTYSGAQNKKTGLTEDVPFTTNPNAATGWGSTSSTEKFVGVLRPDQQAYDPSSASNSLAVINDQVNMLLGLQGLHPYIREELLKPKLKRLTAQYPSLAQLNTYLESLSEAISGAAKSIRLQFLQSYGAHYTFGQPFLFIGGGGGN